MRIKSLNMVLSSILFLALFWQADIYADYIEGIDTTDSNGYGLDSSFKAFGTSFSGKFVAKYKMAPGISCFLADGAELFPYYFDEIKMAADSLDSSKCYDAINFNCSFVLKKANNTYSKFKFLQTLPDHRNVFQFGSNNVPNDRILARTNYDRSILYKPNNLRLSPAIDTSSYPLNKGRIGTIFNWDPPLANDNHLLGYQLHFSRQIGSIDTSLSIDTSQWYSTPLITTTSAFVSNQYTDTIRYQSGQYFNIVAVYQEGKSEFLKGLAWEVPKVNNSNNLSAKNISRQDLLITKKGITFTIQCSFSGGISIPASLAIFNLKGERVACFKMLQSGTISWAPTNARTSMGMYIVKAILPDHTVLTQPFMFTK